MERMAEASRELASIPGVNSSMVSRLLDAGFRSIEEISLASLEDLLSIEGITEDEAIDLHDAAETALEERMRQMEEEEAAAAEAEAISESEPEASPEPGEGEGDGEADRS